MRDDYTHIGIVLDASGSMSHLTGATKRSINQFLDKERQEPGKTVFDLYQFEDTVAHLIDNADLKTYKRDLMASYYCGGCTALNDAVCIAVDELGKRFAGMAENERPAHVMIAILTDGLENASRKFTARDVKKRIDEQKNKYNWDFIYLAADEAAFEAGESLGLIKEDRVFFAPSAEGVEHARCCMEERAAQVRNRKRENK